MAVVEGCSHSHRPHLLLVASSADNRALLLVWVPQEVVYLETKVCEKLSQIHTNRAELVSIFDQCMYSLEIIVVCSLPFYIINPRNVQNKFSLQVWVVLVPA